MKPIRIAVAAQVIFLTWNGLPASAQFGAQLGSAPPTGQPVAPYFEGWFANPDGTYTFSFGYHNFNTEGSLEIPIGPDNFITPSEFDSGEQPTHFPSSPRRDRGIFTVTVPAEFGDGRDVVWTIRANGVPLSVPAHVGVGAYQLDHFPKPAGSLPPTVRLAPDAPVLVGLAGVIGDPGAPGADLLGTSRNPLELQARVGEPLTLKVWAEDNFEEGSREPEEIHVNWRKHQGPAGEIDFSGNAEERNEEDPVEDQDNGPEAELEGDGSIVRTATFPAPGEYLLRVVVDNFGVDDSSAGSQCCWTNAFVRVTVTE